LNTDRQTIDKRDATKNTRVKTFNNPIYTVGLLYSCLQVGHGHWCLIWLLILSFSIWFYCANLQLHFVNIGG